MDDASLIDEMKVWRLINVWGYARDNGEWDMLADCFCHDATINISWIHAPAREFVARSREMTAKRKPGAHLKHMFASPLVRVEAKRAFSVCHCTLESRDEFAVGAWHLGLKLGAFRRRNIQFLTIHHELDPSRHAGHEGR